MFTNIYKHVFPAIFDFFSKIVGLSTCPIQELMVVLDGVISVNYVNLLTGASSSFTIANGYTSQALSLAFNFIFFGIDGSTPLWLASLICFVEVFIAVSLIKFVRDFIT